VFFFHNKSVLTLTSAKKKKYSQPSTKFGSSDPSIFFHQQAVAMHDTPSAMHQLRLWNIWNIDMQQSYGHT
jgi:hypothetical protein